MIKWLSHVTPTIWIYFPRFEGLENNETKISEYCTLSRAITITY